jgi:hypothetical protein
MVNHNRCLHTSIAFTLLLGMVWLSACTGSGVDGSLPAGAVDVDVLFADFYATLGDQDVLGPAISAIFPYGSMQCQYTSSALMCYDPTATSIDQYKLYTLGNMLGVRDSTLTSAQSASERIVDGYVIFSDFVSLYDRLYGARYVGRPLTQARTSLTRLRIEQYFENVAFFRNFDDPPGEVHLLAYGSYACGSGCTYTPPADAVLDVVSSSYAQPFLNTILLLGGIPDFGQPLTQPYIAGDGFLEQIYQNVVLYSPPDRPDLVHLRPLSLVLRLNTTPGAQQYGESNGVIFYPTQGNLGFHIPFAFRDFIERHGSYANSGNPVTEAFQVDSTTFRQCFENYCLDYRNDASESNMVSIAPLGQQYLTWTPPKQVASPNFAFSADSVLLQAGEDLPRLKVEDSQTIRLTVYDAQTQQPLANVEATLTVLYPDGSQYTAHFPPTLSNGSSNVTVPPRPETPNGSVIPYLVCLNVPSAEPICISESYLIWNFE